MSQSNNAQAINTVAPSEKSDSSINSEQMTVLVEQAKKKLKIDWNIWAPFIAIAGLFVAQTAVFMAIFIFLVDKIDGTVQPVLAKSIENGERLVKVELEVTNLNNRFDSLEKVVVELDGKVVELDGKVVELDGKVVELDKKVVIIEEKMVELDEKMVELDGKMVELDRKVVELDEKVVIIEEKMVELDGKINLVDGKLDILIAGQKSNGQ